MVMPRWGSARTSLSTSRSVPAATDSPVSAAVSRTTVSTGCSPWSTAPPGSDHTPGVPEVADARTSSTRSEASRHTAYDAIRRSGSTPEVTTAIVPYVRPRRPSRGGRLSRGCGSLPLDGARGLAGDVQHHPVDLGHLVGDPAGDPGDQVVRQPGPVGGHGVLAGHRSQHHRVPVGAAVALHPDRAYVG